MPNPQEVKRAELKLEALRRSLNAQFTTAQAANDTKEMDRLRGLAREIDLLLNELALLGLAQLTDELTRLTAKVERRREKVVNEQASVGDRTLTAIKESLDALFAQSAEEPLPPPTPRGVDSRTEEPARGALAEEPGIWRPEAPLATPADPIVAADPGPSADARLILKEAHLVALWKRSQFPIDERGVIVFGLRGCRPVDMAGNDFRAEQEISLTPVDYKTMKCTLGQWRPGHGLALFCGSTVPFGATVQARLRHQGNGVNQMGRGRYKRYTAGWHKRSEGRNGHWALLQDCQITLQRTADDLDFDEEDRWQAGRIAGDNIHCAFHMGEDEGLPDVRFSSAGCQTVAGTVDKGVLDSGRGPWRSFMEPFSRELGAQDRAEYVLLHAEEAQQVIRTRLAGKSIILRMGSAGPWVEDLQAALGRRMGIRLTVDGDFGAGTFQAVVDFQRAVVGRHAEDGVVGPITAAELGIALPAFDFDDAIAGGPGYRPLRAAPRAAVEPARAAPSAAPPLAPGEPIAWGGIVRKKHGPAFKAKVIEIAERLRCDANDLMAVMAFETGGSFAPDEKNQAGSGATGLIQFMPKTAEGLGTSIAALERMSAVEQLDLVEAHIRSVAGSRALPKLSDVYMSVLLPLAIGKPESHVLFRKPSKAYTQNKGLDVNKNGRITKAEATAKVHRKLVLGLKDTRIG